MLESARGGTSVALQSPVRPLVLLALANLVLPACITSDIHLRQSDNFPASIESSATTSYPLRTWISFVPTSSTDAGPPEHQAFDLEFVVRDPDVDQPLEFLVFVDGRSTGIADGGRIPVSLDGDRRMRSVTYSTATLLEDLRVTGCHTIEILVSGSFLPGRPEPTEAGDLGTAVWWVATRPDATDVTPVALTGCRR